MPIDLKATTATPVTVRDAVGLPVSVKVYGAVGNGSTDDTAAIELAFAAAVGKTVYFPPGTYVIDDATIAGSCHIKGAGMGQTILKVKNSQAAGRYGLNAGGYDDVTISDLTIDGNKANQSTVNKEAVLITGARAVLRNVEVKNTYDVGVQIYEGTDYLVESCVFRGCAGNSLQLAKPIRARVIGNLVSGGTLAGILCGGADDGHDVTIANNVVWDCDDIGIALGGADLRRAAVTGNTVYGCGDNAIDIGNASEVTVTGNTCHSSRAGIVSDAPTLGDQVAVVGNVVHSMSLALTNPHGIYIGGASRFTITGNIVYEIRGHGIAVAGCVDGVISGNVVMNAGSGVEAYGIQVAAASDRVLIVGNRIGDRRTPDYPNTQAAGILSESDCTNTTVLNNDLTHALTADNTIILQGTGGIIDGNRGDSGFGNGTTVASSATVTLPDDGEYFIISGTTTITSVTAKHAGKRVTLKFSGALTFTDGSNLVLAGNFVTTADDTITLISDGTNWIETGRSVN